VKLREERLSRIFRKVTGQTVFGYLSIVRQETTKTLLNDSNQSLAEIAAHTGLGTLSLFSRNFSHYVGATATTSREQRAKGTPG
jgi:AraC-like DNA-binding protein